MNREIPRSLQDLLAASDDPSKQRAWSAFLEEYSRLIIHVARATTSDHDAVMDRYMFVVEALQADSFRRLRSFSSEGKGVFTTWLVAVARRLCIDEHRKRYGRYSPGVSETDGRKTRRQLTNLDGAVEFLESIQSEVRPPDVELTEGETQGMLSKALNALNPADRLLLKLRFEDDMSAARIARFVGLPSPFHVYRRLEKILQELRKSLETAGILDASK